MNLSTPGFPVHHQLPESTQTMSTELVMPSNHLILCRPLLLLLSIFPSISVFSNESALRIRWPKYWSFSFNISPSNERPGLISFRMDWLDLLAVQGQTDWNHNHRQLANLIPRTTALSYSMKLGHAVWGHPRWMGHGGEVWQNVVHWRTFSEASIIYNQDPVPPTEMILLKFCPKFSLAWNLSATHPHGLCRHHTGSCPQHHWHGYLGLSGEKNQGFGEC